MSAALDATIGDAVDQFALDRDKSREMFIGMLGHDLRDPLNTIVFSAQNLLDDEEHLDARALRAAARIRSNGARMEAMIRDLLDFARGRLGPGLPVFPVPLDARPLIGAAVEDIAHAHPERELTSLAATAAGDFHVDWDGDRIAQAISNLVGNAIAHGSDPIVVEPIDRGETIAIEVRNRGAIVPSVLPGCSSRFRNRQRTAVCPRQSGVTTRGRTRAASGGAVTWGSGCTSFGRSASRTAARSWPNRRKARRRSHDAPAPCLADAQRGLFELIDGCWGDRSRRREE